MHHVMYIHDISDQASNWPGPTCHLPANEISRPAVRTTGRHRCRVILLADSQSPATAGSTGRSRMAGYLASLGAPGNGGSDPSSSTPGSCEHTRCCLATWSFVLYMYVSLASQFATSSQPSSCSIDDRWSSQNSSRELNYRSIEEAPVLGRHRTYWPCLVSRFRVYKMKNLPCKFSHCSLLRTK